MGGGNEQLSAKVLAANNVVEEEAVDRKFLKTYRLGYLSRNSENLSAGIIKSGDIARRNLA